jgi:hypothetical protein
LLSLSLVLPALQPPDATAQRTQAHLDTARAYVGTVEDPKGSNSGPAIDRFLRSVGFDPGTPYCAAFASYVIDEAGAELPDTRTALATRFIETPSRRIRTRTIRARDVLRGTADVPRGAVVVWRRGNGIYGHAGLATGDELAPQGSGTGWHGRCGRTIEANTSPGKGGGIAAQADGQGIWRRTRCIHPGSYFRIVGFVPVRYE